MSHSLPPGPHRTGAAALSGLSTDDSPAIAADLSRAAAQVPGQESLARPAAAGRYVANPFAFVLFTTIELAFVFGLLVFTKLGPSQVLQIAGQATAISVAGFFGRNAIVLIGRRMITGPGNSDA